MTNNQEWFNNKYPKELREIEIKTEDYEDPQGELIIENYLELEKLYLYDIQDIEKITLKNLPKLQDCTIWDCSEKELVIENCSQIKKLNIRKNLLTDLEFLKGLENLETLEFDGNTELVKMLEASPYKGDWKNYRKVIQGSSEDSRKLLEKNLILEEENKSLNTKYKELKRFLKEKTFALLSREEKEKIVDELNKKIKRKDSLTAPGKTKELMLNTEAVIESAKEIKKELEEELDKSKTEIQELKEQFQKKQKEISDLESYVKELTESSKKQKEKIIDAFLRLSPEKELLQKLITAHLEFTKAKNQERDDIIELRNQKNKIQGELEKKVDEKTALQIEKILTDCEKLFGQELELENRLDNKSSLIKEQKEILLKTPDSIEKEQKLRQVELELANVRGQLEVYKQNPVQQQIINNISNAGSLGINIAGNNANQSNRFTYNIHYNEKLANQELTRLEKDYQLIEPVNEFLSDPQKLKKSILFLATKQIFATTRQDTINSLIATYENADKSGKKYDKIALVGDYIGDVKEIASLVPGGGIVANILSKGIPAITNLLKSRSLTKCSQEFEKYLIEDEKALSLLEKTYQSLVASQESDSKKISPILTSLLKFKPDQLNQHSAFEISKLSKEEELTTEKMTTAIDLLKNHFQEFVQELRQETGQYAEKMEELFANEEEKVLQNELIKLLEKLSGQESQNEQVATEKVSLENQIKTKKDYLEKLKDSVEKKLESRFSAIPIVGEVRKEKWKSRLDKLLDRQEKVIRLEDSEKLTKVKKQLKEKLTEEEIINLCQTQIELAKLQLEQEKQIQAQIQLLPKGNN